VVDGEAGDDDVEGRAGFRDRFAVGDMEVTMRR
jgi:hypothetical protein